MLCEFSKNFKVCMLDCFCKLNGHAKHHLNGQLLPNTHYDIYQCHKFTPMHLLLSVELTDETSLEIKNKRKFILTFDDDALQYCPQNKVMA